MRTLSCQQTLASTETIAQQQDITISPAIPAFHIYNRVEQLPINDLHALIPETKPYLRHDFLAAMEAAAQAQMEFRYVLIYKNQRPISFNYFQIVSFDVGRTVSYTDLEKGANLKEKIKNRIGTGFKRIAESWNAGLIVGGNVFLSCEGSHYYIDQEEEEKGFDFFLNAAKEVKKRERKISGILLKDFYQTESHPQNMLISDGYHLFQAEPNMLLQLAPEWKTFEDYLGAMSSKYRQRAKSAYKKSNSLINRELSYEDMQATKGRMNELFQKVVAEDKFAVADAGPEYFIELKRVLGDKLRVEGYYLEDELVAFMTTISTPDHLEAHFLGFDSSLNRSHKIYQRILYDVVKQGLEAQAKFISYGRTALEIKSTIGAAPHPMNIYLKLTNPIFNRLAAPVMRSIEMVPWEQRHPFK